jgi:hypothetical protein
VIESKVLLWTGLGFLALTVVVGSFWLIHAAWATAAELRRARKRPRVLTALAAALQGADPAEANASLGRVTRQERIGVLVEMAFTVAGDQRRRLNELAVANGVLKYADRWSRSRRWGRRLRAARLLALFGRDDEPSGERLLRDRRPEVRAQATEWAANHPTPERVERLADMLGDPSPSCRFFAREALIRAGGAALDPLRARLNFGGDLPGSAGALEAATALAIPEFAVSALGAMRSSIPSVRARGASLAGAVGGPEAARGLSLLLADPSPKVREAAARGLGRLGHWQSAAEVASLLEDSDWGARHAAAESLNRMGPTGELFLRRSSRLPTRASATARHALALPPAGESVAAEAPSEAPA